MVASGFHRSRTFYRIRAEARVGRDGVYLNVLRLGSLVGGAIFCRLTIETIKLAADLVHLQLDRVKVFGQSLEKLAQLINQHGHLHEMRGG